MPTLHWIGKDKVVNHHLEVPIRALDTQYTEGGVLSENKIIHGDNLEALKALLPQYEGKIKCIYIDPPYNTGNEKWVYNDNVNDPKIKKWINETVGKEGEDLSRHDKWLCMMYPRLKLLHRLLADDGAIFISIDDNEQAHLRVVCDEIFGNSNFVAANIWQKRYSRENREVIGDAHEYLLVYAKRYENFKKISNKLPLGEKQLAVYKNPNNDPKGLWRAVSFSAQGFRPNQMYEIQSPKTGKKFTPPEGSCWKVIEGQYEKLLLEGRMYFGKDGNSMPQRIQYLKDIEGIAPWTWWPHEEVGHTDESRKEIQKLFGTQTAFETPKPVRLIERVLQIATNPTDLILDSFAGSGTTAHAVLNLNKADGGSRKFILIEMEDYAENITAERVRRVINGYGTTERTGGSFSYCTLGERLFDDDGNLNAEAPLSKIREYVFFTETKTPLIGETDPSVFPYFLAVHNGTAYYFFYETATETVLNYAFLSNIAADAAVEQYVIYADSCTLSAEFLTEHRIIFKKIPRDITRF